MYTVYGLGDLVLLDDACSRDKTVMSQVDARDVRPADNDRKLAPAVLSS